MIESENPLMWCAENWKDYELLDCSAGERLERWGSHILVRPDPQVIWNTPRENPLWEKYDARYVKNGGGGAWDLRSLPPSWQISYGGEGGDALKLRLGVKAMGFKHTGVFPEQAANWAYISKKLKAANRDVSVLSLFAYTGAATLAAAANGSSVCHVDAARGMVALARENAAASGLENAPIRWIVDDCAKFCERELKRGKRYDAVIMDPPSYGRGPGGEVWKLEDSLWTFLRLVSGLLTENPLFVIINSYTAGLSPSSLNYLSESVFTEKYGGGAGGYFSESGELGLYCTGSKLCLPAGASCRWSRRERLWKA